jgi:hypothetical protein
MSAELLDVLMRFGPLTVLLVAAGAIVAAMIGAANAWAVAWFNARATRQLAVDAAHRDYRKELCADLVQDVRLLDGLALEIRDIVGESLDAGIPFTPEDAKRVVACAREYSDRESGPEFRRPSPDDELFKRAYFYAVSADKRLRATVTDVEAANADDRRPDLSRHRRELAMAIAAVAHAATVVQLAVECFVFDLRGAPRRRLRRLLTELVP